MLADEECKVCVLCLLCLVLIAVTVYCDNAVCVFIYNATLRIHAECTHIVLELFCAVNNLAFVEFVCEV